jgi:hypothetical protein
MIFSLIARNLGRHDHGLEKPHGSLRERACAALTSKHETHRLKPSDTGN